jgi:hypothetical protein
LEAASSQSEALPLSAIEVHDDATEGSYMAARVQHVISAVHAALEAPPLLLPPLLAEPPSLSGPPPLLPPPPSGEHAALHMADSHSNVGPSQTSQLIVWHCASGDAHMLSMQVTHSVVYPPNTMDDGHTQPLVLMPGVPEDEGPSSPAASSPRAPPLEPDGPPEPEPPAEA